MSATQITSSSVPFTPNDDQPLSGLSQSVLDHCTKSRPSTIQPEGDYQLPVLDPYDALLKLRNSAVSCQQNTGLRPQQPSVALEGKQGNVEAREISPPTMTSQKRGAQDTTDDELDTRARPPKKLKSRPPPAAPPIRFEPTHPPATPSNNRGVLLEVVIPSSQAFSTNPTLATASSRTSPCAPVGK